MSGDWPGCRQCVISFQTLFQLNCRQDEIAKDPSTHGSTFVPVILGSNKMVVSMATGHTEYWPLC